MTPVKIIRELVSSDQKCDFGGGVILERYSFGDRWIQFGTPGMKEYFGSKIHYELYAYYSRVRVYLHDERYIEDALCNKLKKIAAWHGLAEA